METVLTLKHIGKVFSDDVPPFTVLDDITLDIGEGEFFVFLGPSGSGKSTLLRIMAGLERSFGGEMQFRSDIAKTDINFIFQQFALLPWLTVYENIELGLIGRNIPLEKRKHVVTREVKVLGLEKFIHSYPKKLSGGMRQRVGIARALVTDPKIIFMDEPFSELDSFTAEELRKEILHIWENRKITIVMVSHNIREALELANRIAVLTSLPGAIKAVVVNDLPRPRNVRSPDFYVLEDHLFSLVKP